MSQAFDKALEELGTSRGVAWNIGMPLPRGRVPCLNYGRKGKSDGGYPSSSRNYGKDWVGDYPQEGGWDDIPRGRAVEQIANEVLDMTGLRFVWIISPNHDQKYCYDESGKRIQVIENGKKKWKTEKADHHITVRLGTDENTCMLHGHINVTVNKDNVVTGFMEEGSRKYITEGDDRIIELWEYTKRPNAVQSNTKPPKKHIQRDNTVFKHKHSPKAHSAQDVYRRRYPCQGKNGKSKSSKQRSRRANKRRWDKDQNENP
ncbi:hypothetical protein F4775DRAFT_591346 [Biscogniauxia sp. FL1348]|nr:hypothetical protein F4775DRAFT_591346 [Biscogniauxia sp. FL1348]